MLKIAAIRAKLGKSVAAKLKNEKDDKERVIEFTISELPLTLQQLTDLVSCNEHERTFAQVAFCSEDAMSELRHCKKIELAIEVHDAILTLDRIGTAGKKLKMHGCSLKGIELVFHKNEKCEMKCKVWAPLEEHALYTIGAWSSQDLYVAVISKDHGKEEEGPNNVLKFGDKDTGNESDKG